MAHECNPKGHEFKSCLDHIAETLPQTKKQQKSCTRTTGQPVHPHPKAHMAKEEKDPTHNPRCKMGVVPESRADPRCWGLKGSSVTALLKNE